MHVRNKLHLNKSKSGIFLKTYIIVSSRNWLQKPPHTRWSYCFFRWCFVPRRTWLKRHDTHAKKRFTALLNLDVRPKYPLHQIHALTISCRFAIFFCSIFLYKPVFTGNLKEISIYSVIRSSIFNLSRTLLWHMNGSCKKEVNFSAISF